MSGFRAAVLAYHSQDIQGNDYATNDHVALAEDLRHIVSMGLPLVSAVKLVDALEGRASLPERCVVLTCDDGADLDFVDVVDELHGKQRSFFNILADQGMGAIMTSFVIADPAARATLEQTCLAGRPWLGEAWWQRAVGSRRWHLGCHSWDHQHPSLPAYAALPEQRGLFRAVDGYREAVFQVGQAAAYLRARAPNPGDRLFAYPYGHWTEYLAREYLPGHRDEHGLSAAFTTAPEYAYEGSDQWLIPRFVCRADWRSPEELARILREI